jgi:hypothetical protein
MKYQNNNKTYLKNTNNNYIKNLQQTTYHGF